MSTSETSPGASTGKWETGQMLDVYILDYLKKRELHASVAAFTKEVNVPNRALAIDAPSGFLFEWWSVFWDIFMARSTPGYSEAASNYVDQQKMRAAQHNLHLQQLQVQHIARLQQQFQAQTMARERTQSNSTAQPSPGVKLDSMQKPASHATGAVKLQEERMRHQQLQALQAMQGMKSGMDRGGSMQGLDADARQMLAAMTAGGSGMPAGQISGVNMAMAQQQAFARGLQQPQQQPNDALAERLQSMGAGGVPWAMQQQAMLAHMMPQLGAAGPMQRQPGLGPHLQSNGQGSGSGGPSTSGQQGSPETSAKGGSSHPSASQQAAGKGKGGKGSAQTSRKRKANANTPATPVPEPGPSGDGAPGTSAALFSSGHDLQQQQAMQDAQQALSDPSRMPFGRLPHAGQMMQWSQDQMQANAQLGPVMAGPLGDFGHVSRGEGALMMGQFGGGGSMSNLPMLDGLVMLGMDDPLDPVPFAHMSKQGFPSMNGLIDSADMDLFMGNDGETSADNRDANALLGGLDELSGMDLMPKGSQGQ